MPEYLQWARGYASAAHSYAAAFSDPDARSLILARARAQIAVVQQLLAGEALNAAHYDPLCGDPGPQDGYGEPAALGIPDRPCPLSPKEWDVMSVLTVALSCEQFSLDLHTPDDLGLQGFTRWTKRFGDHHSTINVGGRYQTPGPVKLPALETSIQLEYDRDGKLLGTDVLPPTATSGTKIDPIEAWTIERSPIKIDDANVIQAAKFGWQTLGPPLDL